MTYKKNDIVHFKSNQPNVHLMEMFGHCRFNPKSIKKTEFISCIKSAIGDKVHGIGCYMITTLAPVKGFLCIEIERAIIAKVEESDLTDEQRIYYHECIK